MNNGKPLDTRLNRVYQNPADKQAVYDDWAASYDDDLVNDLGYVADRDASKALMSLVPNRRARILDAGCGTGLVGRRLADAGYTNIHGLDYSSGMLDIARKTEAYQSLAQHDLTQSIDVDTLFDAAISVGLFAFTEPGAEHLVHITRSLTMNAFATVTVNGKAWVDVGWKKRLTTLEQEYPDMRLVDVQHIEYLNKEGIDGRLLILQRVA